MCFCLVCKEGGGALIYSIMAILFHPKQGRKSSASTSLVRGGDQTFRCKFQPRRPPQEESGLLKTPVREINIYHQLKENVAIVVLTYSKKNTNLE